MPFKSLSQERFLYSQHPDIAKKWQTETPSQSKLPQHVDNQEKKKKFPALHDYFDKLSTPRKP